MGCGCWRAHVDVRVVTVRRVQLADCLLPLAIRRLSGLLVVILVFLVRPAIVLLPGILVLVFILYFRRNFY